MASSSGGAVAVMVNGGTESEVHTPNPGPHRWHWRAACQAAAAVRWPCGGRRNGSSGALLSLTVALSKELGQLPEGQPLAFLMSQDLDWLRRKSCRCMKYDGSGLVWRTLETFGRNTKCIVRGGGLCT